MIACSLMGSSTRAVTISGIKDEVSSKTEAAEEARWLVAQGNWGTVSYSNPDNPMKPLSMIASFADVDGRIFFYLMEGNSFEACLTLSEAELQPFTNYAGAACGGEGKIDVEDPRCAKLSISGVISPCKNKEDCDAGESALFDRHPEMKEWPVDHNFTVYELTAINDIWMIYDYGGGSSITLEEFQDAEPNHHPKSDDISEVDREFDKLYDFPRPHWDKKVERARWVVGKSLWSTVSTISVRLGGSSWGNIRSTVDGLSLQSSTGKPIFYLPTPDPTNIDVLQNQNISLQFSEASLAERLDDKGNSCGGMDAMDPLCACVMISGIAEKVTCPEHVKSGQKAFKERHPLAPWLWKGGAHTGGEYYTIEPQEIMLLDYYGGPTPVDVQKYLDWKVPDTFLLQE